MLRCFKATLNVLCLYSQFPCSQPDLYTSVFPVRSDWLHDLYYFLRRACYFLLGKRQLKVRVNTHPWAWFVPLGAPVQTFIPLESAPAGSLGLDLEITPSFGMNEAAAHRFVRRFVATLRHLHPQASFMAVSWQGKDAWDTHTFAMENADGEKEKALLGKLEHLHQTFLLAAQMIHNQRHPDRPCNVSSL